MHLKIHDLDIELTRKRVKHLRIKVYADGRVAVSAPRLMPQAMIAEAVLARAEWIRKHQQRFAAMPAKPELTLLEGETHFLWGNGCQLQLNHLPKRRSVSVSDDAIRLTIGSDATLDQRQALLDSLYRREIKAAIEKLLCHWPAKMGVSVNDWGVKKMKTRWGTCNITARRIWLNLELAKYPPLCLEYVVVHELVHLLERNHNARFYGFMDHYLPDWREREKVLKTRSATQGYDL